MLDRRLQSARSSRILMINKTAIGLFLVIFLCAVHIPCKLWIHYYLDDMDPWNHHTVLLSRDCEFRKYSRFKTHLLLVRFKTKVIKAVTAFASTSVIARIDVVYMRSLKPNDTVQCSCHQSLMLRWNRLLALQSSLIASFCDTLKTSSLCRFSQTLGFSKGLYLLCLFISRPAFFLEDNARSSSDCHFLSWSDNSIAGPSQKYRMTCICVCQDIGVRCICCQYQAKCK